MDKNKWNTYYCKPEVYQSYFKLQMDKNKWNEYYCKSEVYKSSFKW